MQEISTRAWEADPAGFAERCDTRVDAWLLWTRSRQDAMACVRVRTLLSAAPLVLLARAAWTGAPTSRNLFGIPGGLLHRCSSHQRPCSVKSPNGWEVRRRLVSNLEQTVQLTFALPSEPAHLFVFRSGRDVSGKQA